MLGLRCQRFPRRVALASLGMTLVTSLLVCLALVQELENGAGFLVANYDNGSVGWVSADGNERSTVFLKDECPSPTGSARGAPRRRLAQPVYEEEEDDDEAGADADADGNDEGGSDSDHVDGDDPGDRQTRGRAAWAAAGDDDNGADDAGAGQAAEAADDAAGSSAPGSDGDDASIEADADDAEAGAAAGHADDTDAVEESAEESDDSDDRDDRDDRRDDFAARRAFYNYYRERTNTCCVALLPGGGLVVRHGNGRDVERFRVYKCLQTRLAWLAVVLQAARKQGAWW